MDAGAVPILRRMQRGPGKALPVRSQPYHKVRLKELGGGAAVKVGTGMQLWRWGFIEVEDETCVCSECPSAHVFFLSFIVCDGPKSRLH